MSASMSELILQAYDHPAERAVFYGANGRETASARLNAMRWEWTPTVAERVGGASTCMFPLALGCQPTFTSENKEWIAPLITDPAQVKDFAAPAVRSGRTGELLANLEACVAQLPPGHQIRDPDTQSPLGVAELMWDDSFYFALLEHPDAVHSLLDKITDFIIAFVREVQQICGPHFNCCGFPPIHDGPGGTMVADDTMSLVSPEMHLEFSVPYLNRMAKECGPLHYHSCSWWPHYFENIHRIGPVRSLNWNPGNSADPDAIIGEFSGAAVLTPHITRDMHRDGDVLKWNPNLADEAALVEYIVDCAREDTSLHFWFSNVCEQSPAIDKIYDLLHARGWSPQARGVAG